MYATGSKSGGPGVYHFESLPIAAAPIDFFSDTKTQPSQAMREGPWHGRPSAMSRKWRIR